MEGVDESMTAIERLMGALPMGTSPAGRGLLFAAAGGATAYYVRPEMSFTKDGRPREWILVDPGNPEATLFPWWAYVVVPGVLAGIFI